LKILLGGIKEVNNGNLDIEVTIIEVDDLIYIESWCYKKLKDYDKIVDFSERLRLRHSILMKNLFNLAELYYYSGNNKQASSFIERCSAIDSENPGVKKLQEKVKGKIWPRDGNKGGSMYWSINCRHAGSLYNKNKQNPVLDILSLSIKIEN
jgi:tetratricopeptide (TPR) repeat protein